MASRLPALKDDQETIFLAELINCGSITKAGRVAKYSETTIRSGYLNSKLRKPKVQAKYNAIAKAKDLQHLAKWYSIEDMTLNYEHRRVSKNPEVGIEVLTRLKHTGKEKKQIAGVLAADSIQGQTTINITNIQAVMADYNAGPEQVIDAEVVDDG